MSVTLISAAFIFGLFFGSFLNVCICRIPLNKSIVLPGSHCDSCGHALGVPDLIPIFSFIFLKGKCRYCGAAFSSQNIIIELFTGAVYALLMLKFGLTVEFFAFAFLMSILIIVFFIDLQHSIIPDELVIAGLIGGVPYYLYEIIYLHTDWWRPLVSMLGGSLFFLLMGIFALLIYKKEGIGGGDIKIMAPIGLFLGIAGTFLTVLLSSLIGSIVLLALIIFKIRKRDDMVPYGPFIVIGVFISIMAQNLILKLWLNIG